MSQDELNDLIDVEDEIQDWKNLGMPKRGTKEFEPDGTTFQLNSLEDSRNAMFNALGANRQHHIKNTLVGIWKDDSNSCLVPNAKGNYFKDVGKYNKLYNCIELNPIETIYLVERGSMVIYLSDDEFMDWLKDRNMEFDYETNLVALDLEYLYALSNVNFAKYQIYAYLKRLGYIIQEREEIEQEQEQEQEQSEEHKQDKSFTILPRVWGILSYPVLHSLQFKKVHYFRYTDVYKSIQLNIPKIPKKEPSSPFHLTFNVWKPTPNFSKKSPPLPDFQVSVIDTSKNTDFLKFSQIQQLLFEKTTSLQYELKVKESIKKKPKMESKKEVRAKKQAERQSKLNESTRLRNEYLKTRDEVIKNGHGNIVLAVINNGIINFIQLGIGNFNMSQKTEQVNRLEEIYPGRHHELIYNEPVY
ncbi:unnamed protein product [Candida verbasci]|uniref:tRNA-splicing endonuclease subunit Sen54 N-terminal domain-containing protein n=1 Tax=Candida verbasci TaxID=1227364 RepID=A0A9W4TWE6_9ASCO|nr:unnamed protein product [Candida verbasci]